MRLTYGDDETDPMEQGLAWSRAIEVVYAGDEAGVLAANQKLVEALVGGTIRADAPEKLADAASHYTNAAVFVADALTVAVPDVIDPAKERERLEKQLGKLTKELDKLTKKLGNAGFVEKAPAAVVAKTREEAEGLASEKARLDAALARL